MGLTFSATTDTAPRNRVRTQPTAMFEALSGLRSGAVQRIHLEDLAARVIKGAASDATARFLLHVPQALAAGLGGLVECKPAPQSGRLFIGEMVTADPLRLSLNPAGQIPPRSAMRRGFILAVAGEEVAAVIAAHPGEDSRRGRRRMDMWSTWLTFNPVEAGKTLRKLASTLPDNAGLALGEWLSEAARLADKAAGRGAPQAWSMLLCDLIFGVQQKFVESESKLRWFQALSSVQSAVSWELSTGDLFGAVCDVLKKSVGYHYLEIQLLEHKGGSYEVTASHHRNDTTYGGPLLTVILKPPAQAEVLRRGKPLLVDEQSAQDLLMNPRLIQLMNFHSGALVPLVNRQRINGMLKLFSQERDHFSSADLDLLEAIGEILARSIENVKEHTLLRRMATVDGLTNLFNRRFFMEQLTREFKRARRYQSNLTLIMLDIDHFKVYNDTYGHLQGDEVLRTVGRVLRECVREVDMVGRYGGEEFAVILPEASQEQGEYVAEKIRRAVMNQNFGPNGTETPRRLTVSLGVSSLSDSVETAAELINQADIALYRAKKQGRNCVVSYS